MDLKIPKTGKVKRKRGLALTEADQKFIAHYLKTGNSTESYFAAGFNGNNPGANAYKMLHKVSIQAFLSSVKTLAVEKVAKKLEITVEKVLEDLEEARKTALEANPNPQCAAAIKASELQGRHIGMFRDDFAEREQAPMIRIVVQGGDGTQVAIVGKDEGTLLPSSTQRIAHTEDLTDNAIQLEG